MLERLLSCTSVEDFTALGADMCFSGGTKQLQSELAQERLVFRHDEYWTKDKLGLYSVSELLDEVSTEAKSTSVLHRLQLLKEACPAIETELSRLLKRTTC